MDNLDTFEDHWEKFVSTAPRELTIKQVDVLKRVFCLGGLGAIGALAHMGTQGLIPAEAIAGCEKIEAEIDMLFKSAHPEKMDH